MGAGADDFDEGVSKQPAYKRKFRNVKVGEKPLEIFRLIWNRADASLCSRASLPNSSGLTCRGFGDVVLGTYHFEAHCSLYRGGKLGK
jgi:hypothetical protein